MQRVSEAFLGLLAVKDQTPSAEPAMQQHHSARYGILDGVSLCHHALLLAPGYALLLLGSFRAVSTCRSTITDLSHPILP